MSDTRAIVWAASAYGYRVVVTNERGILEEYQAGNSYYDSQVWIEPSTWGSVSARDLRRYARQTAREWAKEQGVPVSRVYEDVDLLGVRI